jgi:hypothetical protein
MEGKGYRLVTEGKLLSRVKCVDPDPMDNWRLRGIAGTLEAEKLNYQHVSPRLVTGRKAV